MPTLSLSSLWESFTNQRDARDLSMSVAASEIGVARSTLTRIRDGEVPSVETLLSIVRWLDASVEDFACDTCGEFQDEDGDQSAVIVALPDAESAEALTVEGGETPLHVTITWHDLVNGDSTIESLTEWVAAKAARIEPFTAEVAGTGTLGAEDPPANVLFVESDELEDLNKVADDEVGADSDHPTYIPHLTIGYGVEDEAMPDVESVRFDRLGVLSGDELTEYVMGEEAEAVAAAADGGTRVEGVLVVEGEPTGDGRMMEAESLRWDKLPVPIIWDRDDGDHSGMTVGAIESVERRDGGVVWGSGWLSDSDDPDTRAAVLRARELLDEGAVGVSVALDDVSYEIRVSPEVWERWQELDDPDAELEPPADAEGRKIIVSEDAGDWLEVVTAARIRHLAIVDTAAFPDAKIAVAASGALVAAGSWEGRESWFTDPGFGAPGQDDRLRFDPQTGKWSCPVTVTKEGRVFGHITPWGVCLRGRPDRCVTPPDGDLSGFMRGRAPAAGGQRTGTVVLGGSHAATGVGIAAATRHYDQTGRAAADVTVGRDQYGVWFSGMLRPGVSAEDRYALEASDVSGHWEIDQARGKSVLVGLPAVNVGGFGKGYLTAAEVQSGLAASASVDDTESDVAATVARIDANLALVMEAVAPMLAAASAPADDDGT